MTYRRDIDGLRAIAVLAVVIYHAGWTTMSGGFLGVDVFFVISGYLITGILINDWEKGRYSLLTFYERRIRRIFPALFAMLAATILAAMFILLPPDLERLGASVLATTAFVSNIFFWSETGYFATSADSKPLLHTWSLAVEEQFYIFFPLILIGALAFGKRRALAAAAVKEGGRPGLPTAITVMLVLSVVSLIVAEWTVHQAADTAFYWPHTRAWELLAGALIAMDAFKPLRTRQTREWVSGIGFAMVIISLFAISSADTFPGLTAMPAVLGSALIIYAGHRQPEHLPVQDRTLVQQFLGLSPMVGIGLISYSLYLWHWPILVFAAQMSFEPLTLLDRTMLVIASIVAAYLSWRFVEQPFRAKSKPRIEPGARQLKPVQPAFWESRARIFASGGAMAAAALVLGGVMTATNGLPDRFSPRTLTFASAADDFNRRRGECLELEPFHLAAGEICRIGPGAGGGMDASKNNPAFLPLGHPDVPRPKLLLWGDSHADALQTAFESLAVERKTPAVVATYPGCPPFPGITIAGYRKAHRCAGYNREMLRIVDEFDIKTIVLAARWSVYPLGIPDFGDRPRKYFMTDVGFTDPRAAELAAADATGVQVANLQATASDDGQSATGSTTATGNEQTAFPPALPRPTPLTTEASKQLFKHAFHRTIAALQARGIKLYIVEQAPLPGRRVPDALARASALGVSFEQIAPLRTASLARFSYVTEVIDSVGETYDVTRISLLDALCPDAACPLEHEGRALFHDDDHISGYAATKVRDLFVPAFAHAEGGS